MWEMLPKLLFPHSLPRPAAQAKGKQCVFAATRGSNKFPPGVAGKQVWVHTWRDVSFGPAGVGQKDFNIWLIFFPAQNKLFVLFSTGISQLSWIGKLEERILFQILQWLTLTHCTRNLVCLKESEKLLSELLPWPPTNMTSHLSVSGVALLRRWEGKRCNMPSTWPLNPKVLKCLHHIFPKLGWVLKLGNRCDVAASDNLLIWPRPEIYAAPFCTN